jgi:hypothetical protein
MKAEQGSGRFGEIGTIAEGNSSIMDEAFGCKTTTLMFHRMDKI